MWKQFFPLTPSQTHTSCILVMHLVQQSLRIFVGPSPSPSYYLPCFPKLFPYHSCHLSHNHLKAIVLVTAHKQRNRYHEQIIQDGQTGECVQSQSVLTGDPICERYGTGSGGDAGLRRKWGWRAWRIWHFVNQLLSPPGYTVSWHH